MAANDACVQRQEVGSLKSLSRRVIGSNKPKSRTNHITRWCHWGVRQPKSPGWGATEFTVTYRTLPGRYFMRAWPLISLISKTINVSGDGCKTTAGSPFRQEIQK